ncbi:MAG: glycosyltransferase [Calditrichaeota bacterium]|nr:glycosyltransferase [Calditrichota bacterium]
MLKSIDSKKFDAVAVVFYRGHDLDDQFGKIANIRIIFLDKKGGFDFKYLQKLRALIQKEKFDIIQPYNVSARFIGWIMAAGFHVPFTIQTERSARLLYTSLGSRIYQLLENHALRRASLLVANSEAGREFAISRGVGRDKTRVIYNGIDPERLLVTRNREEICREFGIPADAFIVGMVGRIEAQKDPHTIFDAAEIVLAQNENVHFVLVGGGPLLMESKQIVRQKNIDGHFSFAGHQDHVADFFNAMDIFVLASKRSEGCSNSILEAMMLGKPIVATRVGGNAEVVRHDETGKLVPPQNPEALAAAILEILRDERKRKDFGRKGQIAAKEKYSLRAMAGAYENLYFELISSMRCNG